MAERFAAIAMDKSYHDHRDEGSRCAATPRARWSREPTFMKPLWVSVLMEALAERLRSSIGGAVKLVGSWCLDIAALRALLDPIARPLLSRQFDTDERVVLNHIWKRARQRWPTLPRQTTLGGAIMVRLAAVTAAAYETVVARGANPEQATRIVYDIAWAIYRKMGSMAWTVSGVAAKDDAERMRVATVAFRTFPFSAPSYEWHDVASAPGVVGFDCRKCPVADYFKAQQLAELCVQTWCALDFPLAKSLWHSKLERSGSIAGGRSHCDFRWTPEIRTISPLT